MIKVKELVEAFAPHRGDAIVISGRAGRYWHAISDGPTDFGLGDPAMGGHAGFSLGLALAQPERPVVLFDSEGDLLMNLGILATIAEQAPPKYYYFLMDNECYATTGGQPVPNASRVAYDQVARGCGFERTYFFDEIEPFRQALPEILSQKGPVFTWTKIVPEIENRPSNERPKWRTRTPAQIIREGRAYFGGA